MDNFTRNQLYRWTYEKIKANPLRFGGDESNALIQLAYLQELHRGETVEQLPPTVIKAIVSISRIKNKLLSKYPQYDLRVKHKPKKGLPKG